MAVAGATVYGEIRTEPESWTAADVKSLIEGIEQMGKQDTVEKMEGLRGRAEAEGQEAQDALDTIIKLFSEGDDNAG